MQQQRRDSFLNNLNVIQSLRNLLHGFHRWRVARSLLQFTFQWNHESWKIANGRPSSLTTIRLWIVLFSMIPKAHAWCHSIHLQRRHYKNIHTNIRQFHTIRAKTNRNSEDQQPEKHMKASSKLKQEKRNSKLKPKQEATMDTALCIIPPFQAWDDIQRARHYAKDPSYYTFPPAIRLFHPFVPYHDQHDDPGQDVAMIIAQAIEKYQLEPFECTLDKLVIVPHLEELERMEEERKTLPQQNENDEQDEEKDNVQSLIEKEEAIGRKKLAKRKNMPTSNQNQNEDDASMHPSSSPKDVLSKQRKALSEFNGPCVLCLEPNEESKIHIQAFREILRKKIFAEYDPISPSSTVTNSETLSKQRQRYTNNVNGERNSNGSDVPPGMHSLPKSILMQHGILGKNRKGNLQKKKKDGVTFRPLITLGRFSTVTKAVSVAKQLQKQWEPLTFRVTDLHLVSKLETGGVKVGQKNNSSDNDKVIGQNDGNKNNIISENREQNLRRMHGTDSDKTTLTNEGEYGCDAMIMLLGEEWQLLQRQKLLEYEDSNEESCEDEKVDIYDEQSEEQILNLLMSDAAYSGGDGYNSNILYDSTSPDNIRSSTDEDIDEEYLHHLLDEEDDDIDQGATIVIGRTQFMLGEMRQFVGMPASSTMDGKDRTLNDDVSGSARRRGAVHRQGNRWLEGDFGQKEKDYLP